MHSKYLPLDWPSHATIALIAGQGGEGSYPFEMAKSALKTGAALKLISLKAETSSELVSLFKREDIFEISVGDVGGLLKALKKAGAKGAVMAGRVDSNHALKGVFPDLKAILLWASLKEKNADTILSALVGEVEKEGIQVLDARIFMDDQIAQKGVMARGSEKVVEDDMAHAIKIAEIIAQNDVGQSVVTRKGAVLAVEAYEGTDAMILRAGEFKENCKIFAKTIKNLQSKKFDLPVFGLRTLHSLISSGIGTALLKADEVIMPCKDILLKKAKESGVWLIGF